MNAYTTMGSARMHQRDISNVMRAHGHRAGVHLMALERQRGWQAEAELSWHLKHGHAPSDPQLPIVMQLRNEIGIALIRAGRWLAQSKAYVAAPATNVTIGRGTPAT